MGGGGGGSGKRLVGGGGVGARVSEIVLLWIQI